LWSYKIFTLIVGYWVANLSYNLLLKGISGEFKFNAELKGVKADLASASPKIFFILMSVVIISIGLYKGLEIYAWPTDPPTLQQTGKVPTNAPPNPIIRGEK